MIILKSGGQTGADRAALDAAIELGIPCGGWCPKGRRAEDGPIDSKYPLKEHSSSWYMARTLENILDSDGTLILESGKLTGGTKQTKDLADENCKPVLVVNPKDISNVKSVINWMKMFSISEVNVAGPRESKRPGIHDSSVAFLKAVVEELKKEPK
ncbi:MAG: putative molybdenum carrier protein [Candidatus Cloacimonetes bacterium]|jgi:hypothetical protein|nr:putative molybdenum carrier protein [Candidatus Cloacimonadota bacterium]